MAAFGSSQRVVSRLVGLHPVAYRVHLLSHTVAGLYSMLVLHATVVDPVYRHDFYFPAADAGNQLNPVYKKSRRLVVELI